VFAFDSRLTSDSERKPHEYLVNDIMMLNSFAWNKNDKKRREGERKRKSRNKTPGKIKIDRPRGMPVIVMHASLLLYGMQNISSHPNRLVFKNMRNTITSKETADTLFIVGKNFSLPLSSDIPTR